MSMPAALRNSGDEARAELAELIDLQMSPLGLLAMDALGATRGQTVLDVGCGAGETILQLADRVGEAGRVFGVDVGPRVLEVARSRTAHLPQVTLLQEDAADLALPDASLDGIFSRFGVMFFADPIKAFSNMHRMLRPGGKIAFICWRSAGENELDAFPVAAAGLSLPPDSAPFSFEKAATVRDVLQTSGFADVHVAAHDGFASSGGIDEMVKVVTRVGALGMMLRAAPELLPSVEPPVRAALAARAVNGTVRLRTATWVVAATAHAPRNQRSL